MAPSSVSSGVFEQASGGFVSASPSYDIGIVAPPGEACWPYLPRC